MMFRYYYYHRHSSDMQMCRFVFDTSKSRSYDVKPLNYTENDNPEAEPFIPEGGVHHTSKADSDFGKVQFENGTQIREVSFGCRRYEVCCGLECCGDSEGYNTIDGIVLFLLVLLGISGCVCYCIGLDGDDNHSYTEIRQTTTTTYVPVSYRPPSPQQNAESRQEQADWMYKQMKEMGARKETLDNIENLFGPASTHLKQQKEPSAPESPQESQQPEKSEEEKLMKKLEAR
ncbi:hypothetical protein WR25_02793 [Diploscapter pachys]|uniref:CX domain-containing protein n=1 Tax=Diploscapter pachys TaxID=2018661 RepID=A0A2A2LY47_9BILA|nr:hypothetical protein WR25_02793 [Diploscapter pachys]